MITKKERILKYLQKEHDEYMRSNKEIPEKIEGFLYCYDDIDYPLNRIFSFLHFDINTLFDFLNNLSPSSYINAQNSKSFQKFIKSIRDLQSTLEDSEYDFRLTPYYDEKLKEIEKFLYSMGSQLPYKFPKFTLERLDPIFTLKSAISTNCTGSVIPFPLKTIGEGSYATVHKYKDTFYNCFFAVKKARKGLTEDELKRFHIEFLEMKKLNSPFVLKVYKFDKEQRQYIMEYADHSLHKYFKLYNNKITLPKRINLIQQVFKAFIYIHSKSVLHRDISPSNILIKVYEGTEIIKVSDFGLVKLKDSQLTNLYTEIKGAFNDPQLALVGFSNYKMQHEIYALTRLLHFILTGRTTTSDYTNSLFQSFFDKGTHPNIEKRYSNVNEMQDAFKEIISTLQKVNV
ncbi:protein kinase domain-containing protein [Bacillus thuringiensis]|uniref:protein kinase domain-containing protein n=2 Tax=Bacillus cereus group TaxID=86661 RepID=UPI000D56361A|nr:protein kinase [Bacillus thuringiensis]MBD8076472.1 protein kinase [Bacillus thuringiensis]